MYIERIDIKSFGKLNGFSAELSSGVNVIEGANESGKTTVAEFVKFMLYGMQSKASGNAVLSERKKYISWDQFVAAGTMTVNSNGKRILIERSLSVSTDASGNASYRENLKMTDAETGAQLYKGKNPGDVLLGVPEEIFLGTAFVRQLGGTKVDGEKISSTAENLLFSADETVNTEKSVERLDLLRRQLLHKNGKGGSLYEKERARSELTMKLEAAKQTAGEIISVETSVSELAENRENAKARRDAAQKKYDNYAAVKNMHSFDKLHAIEDELSAMYTEREKVLTEGIVNGHFPDREYVNKLYKLSDGLASDTSEIASLSRQLNEAKRERGSDEDIKKRKALFSGDVTAEDVIAEAEARERAFLLKKKNAIALLIFAVFFGAIFAVANWTGIAGKLIKAFVENAVLASTIKTISLIAGVVCAVFATALWASAFSEKRKLYTYIEEYGAESPQALPIVLDDMTEAARRDNVLEHRIESLETELNGLYDEYDKKLATANELIALRGVEAKPEEIPEKLREVLSDSEEICRKETQLSLMTEEKRASRDEIASRLGDADEEAVRSVTRELNISEYDSMNYSSLKLERDFNENAVTRLTEAIHELEVKRVRLISQREDPAELAVKLSKLDSEFEKERMRYNACLLAMETLQRAGESVRESVVPRIRTLAMTYLSSITDGKYTNVNVDGAFSVTVNADGAFRELEYMSGGTADAVYLALRLALVRVLYKSTIPPMIFDEAFAHMDDERAASLVKMLCSSGSMQVLMFTCQSREGNVLDNCALENYKHIIM